MEALFDILLKDGFWFAVIRSTTPILLTTLGAMIAARAGARNIALEGINIGLLDESIDIITPSQAYVGAWDHWKRLYIPSFSIAPPIAATNPDINEV